MRFLQHGTCHVVVRGGSHFCQSPKGGGSGVFLLKRKGGPTLFWEKIPKFPSPPPPKKKRTFTKLAESIQTKISKFGELLSTLQNMENKHVEQYTCLLSDSDTLKGTKRKQSEKRLRNRKRKVRKQKKNKKQLNAQLEANEKHIKNLSNQELTNDQINLLAKRLKFVPCPITKETQIRKQLLFDYDNFARRMRLRYIFHGQDKEPHPFHVKSTWKPPVQTISSP